MTLNIESYSFWQGYSCCDELIGDIGFSHSLRLRANFWSASHSVEWIWYAIYATWKNISKNMIWFDHGSKGLSLQFSVNKVNIFKIWSEQNSCKSEHKSWLAVHCSTQTNNNKRSLYMTKSDITQPIVAWEDQTAKIFAIIIKIYIVLFV